jgi:hypothetical protein
MSLINIDKQAMVDTIQQKILMALDAANLPTGNYKMHRNTGHVTNADTGHIYNIHGFLTAQPDLDGPLVKYIWDQYPDYKNISVYHVMPMPEQPPKEQALQPVSDAPPTQNSFLKVLPWITAAGVLVFVIMIFKLK